MFCPPPICRDDWFPHSFILQNEVGRIFLYELFAKRFAAMVFNLSGTYEKLCVGSCSSSQKMKTSSSSQQSDSGRTVLSKHWLLQAVRAPQDKQERIDLRQAAALQSMLTTCFALHPSAETIGFVILSFCRMKLEGLLPQSFGKGQT